MAQFEILDKGRIGKNLYIFGCRHKGSGKGFVALVKTDGNGDIIRMATFDGGKDVSHGSPEESRGKI